MVIQSLIWPDETICNESEMYFHGEGIFHAKENAITIKKEKEVLLDTYFNAFSISSSNTMVGLYLTFT